MKKTLISVIILALVLIVGAFFLSSEPKTEEEILQANGEELIQRLENAEIPENYKMFIATGSGRHSGSGKWSSVEVIGGQVASYNSTFFYWGYSNSHPLPGPSGICYEEGSQNAIDSCICELQPSNGSTWNCQDVILENSISISESVLRESFVTEEIIDLDDESQKKVTEVSKEAHANVVCYFVSTRSTRRTVCFEDDLFISHHYTFVTSSNTNLWIVTSIDGASQEDTVDMLIAEGLISRGSNPIYNDLYNQSF